MTIIIPHDIVGVFRRKGIFIVSSLASALDDWLTTKEVAAHYGVPPKAVLRMIREGRLQAYQKGWIWLVHRDDLPSVWPPTK